MWQLLLRCHKFYLDNPQPPSHNSSYYLLWYSAMQNLRISLSTEIQFANDGKYNAWKLYDYNNFSAIKALWGYETRISVERSPHNTPADSSIKYVSTGRYIALQYQSKIAV